MTAPFPEDVGAGRQLWHHPDGMWSASDRGGWLPGTYADREAALLAFDVSDEELVRLRDRVQAEGDRAQPAITVDMLRGFAGAPAALARVAVLSWDYRQQPDLERLARVVHQLSGGRVHLREVNTGGQDIAVVLADSELSGPAAAAAYERWYGQQATLPEIFELEERG